jgi:hypothetical protein
LIETMVLRIIALLACFFQQCYGSSADLWYVSSKRLTFDSRSQRKSSVKTLQPCHLSLFTLLVLNTGDCLPEVLLSSLEAPKVSEELSLSNWQERWALAF